MKKITIWINLIISLLIQIMLTIFHSSFRKSYLSSISVTKALITSLPSIKPFFLIYVSIIKYLITIIPFILLLFFQKRETGINILTFISLNSLLRKSLSIIYYETNPCLESQKIAEFNCSCDFGQPNEVVSNTAIFFFCFYNEVVKRKKVKTKFKVIVAVVFVILFLLVCFCQFFLGVGFFHQIVFAIGQAYLVNSIYFVSKKYRLLNEFFYEEKKNFLFNNEEVKVMKIEESDPVFIREEINEKEIIEKYKDKIIEQDITHFYENEGSSHEEVYEKGNLANLKMEESSLLIENEIFQRNENLENNKIYIYKDKNELEKFEENELVEDIEKIENNIENYFLEKNDKINDNFYDSLKKTNKITPIIKKSNIRESFENRKTKKLKFERKEKNKIFPLKRNTEKENDFHKKKSSLLNQHNLQNKKEIFKSQNFFKKNEPNSKNKNEKKSDEDEVNSLKMKQNIEKENISINSQKINFSSENSLDILKKKENESSEEMQYDFESRYDQKLKNKEKIKVLNFNNRNTQNDNFKKTFSVNREFYKKNILDNKVNSVDFSRFDFAQENAESLEFDENFFDIFEDENDQKKYKKSNLENKEKYILEIKTQEIKEKNSKKIKKKQNHKNTKVFPNNINLKKKTPKTQNFLYKFSKKIKFMTFTFIYFGLNSSILIFRYKQINDFETRPFHPHNKTSCGADCFREGDFLSDKNLAKISLYNSLYFIIFFLFFIDIRCNQKNINFKENFKSFSFFGKRILVFFLVFLPLVISFLLAELFGNGVLLFFVVFFLMALFGFFFVFLQAFLIKKFNCKIDGDFEYKSTKILPVQKQG